MVDLNVGIIFFIFSVSLLMFSLYNYIMVLLSVEFFMLLIFMFFCVSAYFLSVSFDFMFMFICMMVLEGVIGLCLLMKNYRFESKNLFISW